MPKIDFIIQEIANAIDNKKLEIFCGAGISFNSGIPMAVPIVDYILTRLGLPEDEKGFIKKSQFPFEAFIEYIFTDGEFTGFEKFIEIFKLGEPNKNHFLIAKLAKTCGLRRIYTTNFDTLLEKAFENENTKFIAKINESDFQKKNEPEQTEIIKLHGCISNSDTIAIMLHQVANRGISPNRKLAMQNAFEKGEGNALLILGYSFSDVFDLVPVIQQIQKNTKVIYVVDHQYDNKEDFIAINQKDPKLKSFNGFRVFINTDVLVERLWRSCLHEKLDPFDKSSYNNNHWTELIDLWANETLNNVSKNYKALGQIFTTIGLFPNAEKWFNEALSKSVSSQDEILNAKINQDLANLYRNRGLYNKSIETSKKALIIAEKHNDPNGVASCSGTIADNLKHLKEYENALEYIDKAIQAAKLSKNPLLMSKQMNSYGLILFEMGKIDKSLEIFEIIRKAQEQMGDIRGEAFALGNIARAKKSIGKVDEAKIIYERVIEIAKQLDDKRLLSNNLMNLAIISRPEERTRLEEQNLELSKLINDPYFIGRAYHNMAVSKHNDGKLKEAFELATESHKYLKPIMPSTDIMIRNLEDNFGCN